MRIDRPARTASFLLTVAVGVAFTTTGCGLGGDETVRISPDAQKKTQDMLGNMQKKMFDLHKARATPEYDAKKKP
jgi:hypothetical protein